MRKFKSNRLVRDKIIAGIVAEGSKAGFRILNDEEYQEELKKKVREEANELPEAEGEEVLKELADIQETVDCLVKALGLSKKQLRETQKQKRVKAGSFKKRHFLETVEMADDCKWLDYYLKSTDKFQEIKL
jgi:predicted house-cleaning noncanonical NTP pyrophosphatase (MazG superfamily)